jgi:hypothetical protein
MADKMYVGDIGTIIRVDTEADLTNSTTRQIKVKKPDGTTADWTATLYDTTKIQYTIQSGDFDQAGNYQAHAYVILPSGTWRGEHFTFQVYAEWD